MKKWKLWKKIVYPTVLVILLIAFFGFNQALKIQSYTLKEKKLDEPVRLALLTDLHSCKYGEQEQELIDAIDEQDPDVILLGGDIIDDEIPETYAWYLLEDIGKRYPCFYVSGNHEIWTKKIDVLKRQLEECGIFVLDGKCVTVAIRGQEFNIAGVDDPAIGNARYRNQVVQCASETNFDLFTVFLTHRPERVGTYREFGYDFILAGHAHGGQWRFPPFCNGVYAPTQGWWPKYVGGYYAVEKSRMIVGRGLARETNMLPRFYNRPELVIIDLEPE